jgi:shikimate dehydrogenase
VLLGKKTKINQLIENKPCVPLGGTYTAIIGMNPSKGARSPALWNSVFEKFGILTRMYPFDLMPDNLQITMGLLNDDCLFLGGAVTMPYKESVARWLGPDRLTAEARQIGAVNCIYRKPRGQLFGTNTDGEAALNCFTYEYGTVKTKSVLMLGFGGAGKAIAAYFSTAGAVVTICIRNKKRFKWPGISSLVDVLDWSDFGTRLNDFDIVINATDVGFSGSGKEQLSPLSLEHVRRLKSTAVVYDVIYSPEKTVLISISQQLGLRTLGGGCMNLEQAALGFHYCIPGVGPVRDIRDLMIAEKARRNW